MKNINMYPGNYSKFLSKYFHDDVPIQRWNYDLDNPTVLFNDLEVRRLLIRHAPIKKLDSRKI